LGELHGTQEIPEYTRQLVVRLAKHHRVLLGVEQREDTGKLPCGRKGSLPESWQAPQSDQDGRTSRAMQSFICKVRSETPHRLELVYLDQRTEDAPVLDKAAAAKFASRFKRSNSVGVILVGNFHSRNAEDSIAGHLRSQGLRVVSATASSAQPISTAWQCREDGCGVKAAGADMCRATSASPEWIKSPDPRWDYCLLLPKLTASPPADSENAVD
jgi:hypothetical protein